MAFTHETALAVTRKATKARLDKLELEKAVLKAAIVWVAYIECYRDNQIGWQSMPQIRLCEAVERLQEFTKYGTCPQ